MLSKKEVLFELRNVVDKIDHKTLIDLLNSNFRSFFGSLTNDISSIYFLINDEVDVTIYDDGCVVWHKDDIAHRDDGPAVIHPNGSARFWFCEGVEVKHE